MQSLKRLIETAKTARSSVVDHMNRTFKRALLYVTLTVAFYFAIQDSGLMFWVPAICMVLVGIAGLFKTLWGIAVFAVLYRVDSTVEDVQTYTDVAVGVSSLARNAMQSNNVDSSSIASTPDRA